MVAVKFVFNGNLSHYNLANTTEACGFEAAEVFFPGAGCAKNVTVSNYIVYQNYAEGTVISGHIWEYIFANSKSVQIYSDGILIHSDTQSSQKLGWTNVTVVAKQRGSTSPTFLEQLYHLDTKKSRHYNQNL